MTDSLILSTLMEIRERIGGIEATLAEVRKNTTDIKEAFRRITGLEADLNDLEKRVAELEQQIQPVNTIKSGWKIVAWLAGAITVICGAVGAIIAFI